MYVFYVILICCICCVIATKTNDFKCNVRMRIDSGWVCGLIRQAELNVRYASFRGIPYAKQPLRELRFQELQPAEPWLHHLDATEEGPICPQYDAVFGHLVKPLKGMSESCIFVNVHVPLEALPKIVEVDELNNNTGYLHQDNERVGYPIFVFIHGGGFYAGSGDTDLYGPEYLVSKGVIVITFSYRINVFGFLSLNTPSIPGNAGLRDQVTLLRWVQRNARAFGGDPHEVTIGGQSSGSASAHLLALSKATKGLFKRVILISGTAIPTFYSASPVYAATAAATFLNKLSLNNTTDPELIHQQLIDTPIEAIVNAFTETQDILGLVSFTPVVEAQYPGVTRIVDDEPINLIQRGRDKQYPMIIGFTNNECETWRRRVQFLQMLRRIKENPARVLTAGIQFSTAPNVALALAEKVINRYFHGKLNYDDYLRYCTDSVFHHPAFQLIRWREGVQASPSYLYQFSYDADFSVIKYTLFLKYKGGAHIDDLPFIFRENALLGSQQSFPPANRDDHMKDWMTMFVVNFMRCNNPSCGASWPPAESHLLNYQLIKEPGVYINTQPTPKEQDMIYFLDEINQIAGNLSTIGTIPGFNPSQSWRQWYQESHNYY